MPTRYDFTCALAALAAFFAAGETCAEQKPLWEFGMGAGAIGFADYRGADTSHAYPIPVPYFVYRGKFLKAGRDGVRGLLLNREFAELNVSANATPILSNRSDARRGMPDLKPTIELGPSLDLHLWHSADRHLKFDVRLPLRAALTIESSPRAIGWLFSPHLALDVTNVAGHAGWNLGLLAGPLFADSTYHEYFYSVAPQFSTAQRPVYDASAGYAGTEMLAAVSKRFPGYWVGAYARYDTLSGATFAPSPLVQRNSYWSAGIAIAWMVGQSSRLVDSED